MNTPLFSTTRFAVLRRLSSAFRHPSSVLPPPLLRSHGATSRPLIVTALAFSLQLSAFSLFPACARRETAVAAGIRTQTLHVNNFGEPRDFDPQTANGGQDISIIRTLMEGLTEVDSRDGQPIPGVAEHWEASADGLTWTFHLRANARWSNGDPVTARDFAYAWQSGVEGVMPL